MNVLRARVLEERCPEIKQWVEEGKILRIEAKRERNRCIFDIHGRYKFWQLQTSIAELDALIHEPETHTVKLTGDALARLALTL